MSRVSVTRLCVCRQLLQMLRVTLVFVALQVCWRRLSRPPETSTTTKTPRVAATAAAAAGRTARWTSAR